MKKYGSKSSSSSKNMDQLVDSTNSLSLDTRTLVVQKNATNGCQHFSMRQYVADTWKNDRKACNPFEEKNYQETSQILAAKLSTLQLCPSTEHRASGDAKGEDSKAPIDGEIHESSSLEELERVTTLLKEKEPAESVTITSTKVNDNVQSLKNCCRGHPYGHVDVNQRKTRFSRQEFVRPGETKNAKRRSPFSQNTEIISRKRLKVAGDSSCPCQDKQKGTLKRSGTGPNPLLRHIYEKLAARYMWEPFTPPLKPEENSVTRHRDFSS